MSEQARQELRLALAMRGGASLAVWIGGAAAEINRLRLASERGHPWAELADLAGYDAVSVDVLAGTSAGGLNAALLAGSLVYGLEFDRLRQTWIELADVEAMARPVPMFWQRRPQSLLDGDGYFREELAKVLRKRRASHTVQAAADSETDSSEPAGKSPKSTADSAQAAPAPLGRVDLLLTATLLDPITERHYDRGGSEILEPRRRALFHFRHLGSAGDALSEFAFEQNTTAWKLAHAARTTSSFPFAFEPAQVRSCPQNSDRQAFEGNSDQQGVTQPVKQSEPDMYGVFSEVAPRTDPQPFRVIDGGVLDNIPVSRAIRAIADAPADRPTSRWLLYLNPEPDLPSGDETQSARSQSKQRRRSRRMSRLLAGPVASTAMQAQLAQESLLSDIHALHEHNELVRRIRLRRRALLSPLRAAEERERRQRLGEQVQAVRGDHAVVRAELDAVGAHDLLRGALDKRWFIPPTVDDPLRGWSNPARAYLPARLSAVLTEQAREYPQAVFDDAYGLHSAVDEAITWVRLLEQRHSCRESQDSLASSDADSPGNSSENSENSPLAGVKAALYRLRIVAEVLAESADQYWVRGAELEPLVEASELDDWIRRIAQRRQRLQHELPAPIRPLLGAVLQTVQGSDHESSDSAERGLASSRFQGELAELAAELRSIVESSGADAVLDQEESPGEQAVPNDVPLLDEAALIEQESALDQASATAISSTVDAVSEARDVLGRILARIPSGMKADQVEAEPGFALLESTPGDQRLAVLGELVVLTAPLEVGRAPTSEINFLRVASDEPAALPFTALANGGEISGLRLEDKIRGGDLGNFGAFLDASWRANDWMWGRLDAAASLVRLLVDPARWSQHNESSEDVGDRLQALVSRATEAELGPLSDHETKQWRQFLAELWARNAAQVREELDAVFEHAESASDGAPRPALNQTRQLLTERLQWMIAAEELPHVRAEAQAHSRRARNDPEQLLQPEKAREPIRDPQRLEQSVRHYSVGRQRVKHVGETRISSIVTRCGLLAARALRPSGFRPGALIGKALFTLLKPLLLVAFFVLGAPRRAALTATIAGVAVGVEAWGGYLTPTGLSVLAIGLTWLATPAYRLGARVGAMVVTAVVFALSLFGWGIWPASLGEAWYSWPGVGLGILVVAYAQSALVSSVDVLRPRRSR